MVFTLSKLLADIYGELGQLTVTTATGGTTTTAADSKQHGIHQDDDWIDGSLLVIEANGTPPEGEFQRINGYENETGTFTVDTAFGAAIEAGDTIGFVSSQYPLRTLIELANAGLRALGDIALADTSTLSTHSGETEYPAAVEWKRRRPLMIDYQGKTGAMNENQWVRVYDWEFVPAAQGSPGKIVFDRALPAGRRLRVWYVDQHTRVSAYDNAISETITPELAVAAGVERALRWQNSRLGGGDPFLLRRWRDAKFDLARARKRFPIWTPRRVGRLMRVTGG